MAKLSFIIAFAGLTPIAIAGCAADTGELAPEQDVGANEEDLLKKTGPTSSWSYRGLMPTLDSPSLTVSLQGHTVHVSGLLPASFTGPLPFYAKAEVTAAGRTRVHLAYPIATVDPAGHLGNGTPTRNPEPFGYTVCGGDNFHATNATGAFGGFPFIEYVCSHRDADGRRRSGIAFHGPITSRALDGATYWSLTRGPVSHACNRMLGEHVLELAHVIGFDRGARGTPVKVVAGFDQLGGKNVDVDYPATGWTRPASASAVVFPIWQAVKRRSNGSTALDFPQWACETSRCPSMPANARDPYSGDPI